MTRWLVNGEPDALIAPTDRGLLYGDGLFETILFHRGRSALWSLHMARLVDGCRGLALPQPDVDLLAAECHELLGNGNSAVIRIAITRGSGGRKHMNRLEQVLIAEECARRGADEALVLDSAGMIVEGLAGNIVVVRDGRLIAPGPHPAAVAGVGLEWLRRRAGSDLEERPFGAAELTRDDALWVINSVRGPCPVRTLDGRALVRDERIPDWRQRWQKEVEE